MYISKLIHGWLLFNILTSKYYKITICDQASENWPYLHKIHLYIAIYSMVPTSSSPCAIQSLLVWLNILWNAENVCCNTNKYKLGHILIVDKTGIIRPSQICWIHNYLRKFPGWNVGRRIITFTHCIHFSIGPSF